MNSAPHILMCPPDCYGIEYEINPWMSRQHPSCHAMAVHQWKTLRDQLQKAGAAISCVSPVAGLPDMVFTANAAMIFGDLAVLSRFRHAQRQDETQHYRRWLSDHGFRVRELPSGVFFEGAGDALFCGDTLFAGYRIRSDAQACHYLSELLSCRVIPLELVLPRYYHLDTCFCPLTPRMAIYYPPAFDDYGRRVLSELIEELIPVNDAEAQQFACNAVVLGRRVITNTGCPELHRQLQARGFQTSETVLSEFVKAGGSAKCLTLRLDGEEAAAWRWVPSIAASADLSGTEVQTPILTVTPEAP